MLRQLGLHSKVKLKLEQPPHICVGRDFKECHYRGKVVGRIHNMITITFKYKGERISEDYNLESDEFSREDLKDIKLQLN